MVIRSHAALARPVALFVALAILLISGACAAPAPSVGTESFPPSVADEPQVSVLPGDASAERIETALADTFLAAEEAQLPVYSTGSLPQTRRNYYGSEPLTAGGALIIPQELDISPEALADALTPHLLGRVGVTCVETDQQAFWLIDKEVIATLLNNLDPESALYASVASCGAECQDCGCIGPMTGPTCPASLIPEIPVLEPATE